MRKLLYIAALFSLSVNVYAQDESTDVLTTEEETVAATPNLSKSGKQITPQAGDMGLSMDASPFLDFAGNILNNTAGNNAPTVLATNGGFLNSQITFRYFLEDNMAVRARVGISQTTTTTTNLVQQDNQTDPNVRVEDRQVQSANGFNVAGGIEMRRGNGRLQGYYGGELAVSKTNNSFFREYGNALTQDNQAPRSTVGFGAVANNGVANLENRLIASYGGRNVTVGLNGVIGAEYFFGPRMSIGAEFILGFGLGFEQEGENQTEEWSDDGIEFTVTPSENKRFIRDFTTNPGNGGNVTLNLYF